MSRKATVVEKPVVVWIRAGHNQHWSRVFRTGWAGNVIQSDIFYGTKDRVMYLENDLTCAPLSVTARSKTLPEIINTNNVFMWTI